MRSWSVLLFAFVATSYAFPNTGFSALEVRKDRNGTRSNSGDPTKQACKQMQELTFLTELAANQTRLDELVAKGKMDTAEIDALKTKAAEAITTLKTMESNTTLTSECAVINAERQTVQECKQMKKLQKLANLASNTTALDAMVSKKELNNTEVDRLKQKIQGAATKLQEMPSNTTLTDFCAQRQEGKGTASGDSTTSSGAAAGSDTAAQVSTNGAGSMRLTLTSVPYVFAPLLAGVFAFLL